VHVQDDDVEGSVAAVLEGALAVADDGDVVAPARSIMAMICWLI